MAESKFKIERIKERGGLSHFCWGADNSICNLVVGGRNSKIYTLFSLVLRTYPCWGNSIPGLDMKNVRFWNVVLIPMVL